MMIMVLLTLDGYDDDTDEKYDYYHDVVLTLNFCPNQ